MIAVAVLPLLPVTSGLFAPWKAAPRLPSNKNSGPQPKGQHTCVSFALRIGASFSHAVFDERLQPNSPTVGVDVFGQGWLNQVAE